MAADNSASHLERVVRDAQQILEALGHEWALVGGLAVSARTEPRFTRDVDLAVAVDGDPEAEALVRHFQSLGYPLVEVLEHETSGRLATVRLEAPAGGARAVVLDLLFATSGIEPETVRRSTVLEVFPDLRVPVAALADLLACKILARDDERRPQDAVDIRALVAQATPADLATARQALALIAERGYHRNRDLLAELERANVGSLDRSR